MRKYPPHLFIFFVFFFIVSNVFAQTRILTGTVKDSLNQPLVAATISVKGKNISTTTTANGNFSLNVPEGNINLMVSYIGYTTATLPVTFNQNTVTITLEQSANTISDVVVTALGIQRQAKSLTYSVQQVDNKDLTTVKNANFINSLQGKVSGVTITQSTSGIGGSTRVILRGNKSTRENQPLYVVDGVPLLNASPAQPGDEYGQSLGFVGVDGGDGISNLNPDDIASITVLKGASSAALYGSAAANGVILITTKKGKAGKINVNYSSEVTFENRLYKVPLQYKYGQGILDSNGTVSGLPAAGIPGSEVSWGPVVNAQNNVDQFFQTGATSFNSIALSGGTDKAQTYFSYSYADNKGIIPTSSLKKNNFDFRETVNLNDRLKADMNILFVDNEVHNRPVSGLYDNPLIGLYEFPRGLDFNKYKTYEVYSPVRNTYIQNWWNENYDSSIAGGAYGGDPERQNPYWLLQRNPSDNKLQRVYSNITLNYKLNNWISIQARGNVDKSFNDITLKSYATTNLVLTANNGGYFLNRYVNTQLYADLLVTGTHKLTNNLNLSATVGTSINDQKSDQSNFGTANKGDGLQIANIFTLTNIYPDNLTISQSLTHKQVQAVFGTAQLSLNNNLFLDLTGRNDWSSTFAFTPTEKKGYFYYSAGLTGVLSDMLRLPEPISFSKLRVSYAKVGNDVNIYATNIFNFYTNFSTTNPISYNTSGPYPGTYLVPEDNRSFEAGTEWRFFKDMIGFDFTYYVNNNHNQFLSVPAPSGSAYATYYLNGGNIRNNGVELSVFATPFKSKLVTWNTTVNYALNKNKVVSLTNNALHVTTQSLTITGIGNLLYASYDVVGGSVGDIYGKFFERDANGAIVVDNTGAPLRGTDTASKVGDQNLKLLGNPNPKYTLGWDNTFNIGNLSVDFLFEGRFGGQVMSVTQAVLDKDGYSENTARARDNGGVNINAVYADGTKPTGTLNTYNFYNAVGGQDGIGEYYIYSATAVRLREAAIGYLIPLNVHWIKSLKFSVIGRNLFFVYKKAPFDPETSMSTGNGLQGTETFGLPTTRSIGFSLNVGF